MKKLSIAEAIQERDRAGEKKFVTIPRKPLKNLEMGKEMEEKAHKGTVAEPFSAHVWKELEESGH